MKARAARFCESGITPLFISKHKLTNCGSIEYPFQHMAHLNGGNLPLQQVLFDGRFLDQHTGPHLMKSPIVAIVELIANAWDAGATQVEISWPLSKGTNPTYFSIKDNGVGMTRDEFEKRWLTLAYDRGKEQGSDVVFPNGDLRAPRHAFGRNGVGRFAGFCFGPSYYVKTAKDGVENVFQVSRDARNPLVVRFVKETTATWTGTQIYRDDISDVGFAASFIRKEIGLRFLVDPDFNVSVDGVKVDFEDISNFLEEIEIDIDDDTKVLIKVIDSGVSEKTTQFNGISWRVEKRLVGETSWEGPNNEDFLDGRRASAKRLTFVVFADSLEKAVKKDWTGFDETHPLYRKIALPIYECIGDFINQKTESERQQTIKEAIGQNKESLNQIGPLAVEKWEEFMDTVQIKCPALNEKEVLQIAGLLANLEKSRSRFGLLHKLSCLSAADVDQLNDMLEEWGVDMAKLVLDELNLRFKVLEELRARCFDNSTDEVQELQPLFERGLWVFGPEFESIEFTSNRGMTEVIQSLFKKDIKGSRNRPDFAIIPDGSVGFYHRPDYDDDYAENNVARLIIVELKKPSVALGDDEKAQAWKYVKELLQKGLIQDSTKVTCFVLGRTFKPQEGQDTTHGDNVRISPVVFDTVIKRAETRLFNLHKRIKSAPFLAAHRKELERFNLNDGSANQVLEMPSQMNPNDVILEMTP